LKPFFFSNKKDGGRVFPEALNRRVQFLKTKIGVERENIGGGLLSKFFGEKGCEKKYD